MSATGPVRVLVIAQDILTRAGLAALVSEAGEFALAGQSEGGDALLADVDLYRPDVLLWEVPQTAQPSGTWRDLGVSVVAIVVDDEGAAAAWRRGARGILPRDVASEALSAAIRAVNNGLVAVDRRFASELAPSSGTLPEPPAETLTDRELEVLQLVAEGLPNKSIAGQLGVSEHTVKFHVNSILGKLRAQSRTQAVTAATRLGLIKL